MATPLIDEVTAPRHVTGARRSRTARGRLHRHRAEVSTSRDLAAAPSGLLVVDDMECLPTVVDARAPFLDETRVAAPPSPSRVAPEHAPTPVTDFGAWMLTVPGAADPARKLRALERLRGDRGVVRAAVTHLGARADAGESTPLVFAIVAAAHLRAEAARPTLVSLCEGGVRRLMRRDALPEPEQHFALAALRTLDRDLPLRADTVYAEYEEALAEVVAAQQRHGTLAAENRLERLATAWLDRFSDALGEPGPSARAAAAAAAVRRPAPGPPPPRPRPSEAPPTLPGPNTLDVMGPPAAAAPLVVSAAALGCGAMGLTNGVLHAEAGGLFGALSALSLLAAVGLVSDRGWGVALGVAACLLNAAHLFSFAFVASTWVPPAAPVLGALVVGGLGLGLLSGPVRRRYARPRDH